MRLRVIPCLIVGALLPLQAAEPAAVNRTTMAMGVAPSVFERGPVKRVDFYQTADGGASWLLVKSVKPDGDKRPRYVFEAPSDGTYGFRTVVAWSDGRAETPPKPGEVPRLQDTLIIDTTDPVVVELKATATDSQGGARISWAIRDLNPGTTPGQLQVLGSDGSWQDVGPKRRVYGRVDLQLPGGASRLRLLATDRAGNTGQKSVPLAFSGSLPVAPEIIGTDPVEETPSEPTIPSINQDVAPPATVVTPRDAAPGGPVTIVLPSIEALKEAKAKRLQRRQKKRSEVAKIKVPEGHQDVVIPNPDWQLPKDDQRHDHPEVTWVTEDGTEPVGDGETRPTAQATLDFAKEEMRVGNAEAALPALASLLGTQQGAEGLLLFLKLSRSMGRHQEAIGLWNNSTQQDRTAAAAILVGRSMIHQGNAEAAIPVLEGIAQEASEYREARYQKARALLAAGYRGEAEDIMRSLSVKNDTWGSAASKWLEGN